MIIFFLKFPKNIFCPKSKISKFSNIPIINIIDQAGLQAGLSSLFPLFFPYYQRYLFEGRTVSTQPFGTYVNKNKTLSDDPQHFQLLFQRYIFIFGHSCVTQGGSQRASTQNCLRKTLELNKHLALRNIYFGRSPLRAPKTLTCTQHLENPKC